MPDKYNLKRFVDAQEDCYAQALAEINAGHKHSHWMWYIFPQVQGLGRSATARYYAIRSRDEARAYLNHALLGRRLRECAQCLRKQEGMTARQIFGSPDDLKLKSCMTLFDAVAGGESVFAAVLDQYYNGKRDGSTLAILSRDGGEVDSD
ncbi:hypothetical protein Maes01_01868 [Microbulbifer aestuariivivens]|uniref:DUF1810 domain-containing protein n=1 Tax=Microbulbifer aestuariivivens TaxID=1908308 RepID=A0ABP9WQ21_9GAMM